MKLRQGRPRGQKVGPPFAAQTCCANYAEFWRPISSSAYCGEADRPLSWRCVANDPMRSARTNAGSGLLPVRSDGRGLLPTAEYLLTRRRAIGWVPGSARELADPDQ